MDALNAFLTKVEDQILTPIIELIALAAFIFFLWGLVVFIAGAGDEEKRRTGRQHMIWGIVGLVIIFGASVIVKILTNIVT